MTNSTHTADLNEEELLLQAFDEAKYIEQSVTDLSLAEQVREVKKRYDRKSLLGEGALKKVYLAYDELLDRDVALAKMKEEGHIDDFFNEARLASRLEHPYISSIYDMGYDEEGEAFFVMKLYEGINLYEELQSRRQNKNLELSWILNIFSKVCEAVAFAHGKGVLHLDIKPSNIRIDDFGEVLLCDWGISRAIGQGDDQRAPLKNIVPIVSRATLLGELRGTPGFMAPEQMNKKACDERTDVYGLGALLFDMLIGQPPSKNKYFGNEKVSNEIQAICLKAINEDADQRYSSVASLLEDLQKYNNGLVTQAENAGSWQVLRKWLIRHRKSMIILGANFIVILSLILFYIHNIKQTNIQLEFSLDELEEERQLKEKFRLDQADRYYKQGFNAYANSVSQFDYDEDDISLALTMLLLSVELNPNHSASWMILGNLRVLRQQYTEALACYEKAGEEYDAYYKILSDYVQDTQSADKIENELELIRRIDPLKDRRFRNHLIFKGIHGKIDRVDLFQFSLGALAIVNYLDKIIYKYDESSKTLDLSQNQLRTVYPLKTLRIEALILKGHLGKGHELFNLRNIPLKYLDLSYSEVVYLDRLLNVEIEELNLEGTPMKNLKKVKEMAKLRKINIYGIPAKLTALKDCNNLEQVTCSITQEVQLRKLLKPNVKLIIKP